MTEPLPAPPQQAGEPLGGTGAIPSALADDVQNRAPRVEIGLSRVGVTGVEKVIRVGHDLYIAHLDCYIDLGSAQKGAHMSRFEEVVNEAIGEAVLGRAPLRAENLARQIAEEIRRRQKARRAEVRLRARYPEHKPAPVSGIQTQELYNLIGIASATPRGTRCVVGVEATGMTACPCAQELVGGRARAALAEGGFSPAEIARVLSVLPLATHNQRGLGTLLIGCAERHCESVEALEAGLLLQIVEQAMSSEIYELMKRADEVEVVEKAHRRPRFVEDCVREMVAGVVARLPSLPDSSLVCARQKNLETIHQHDVVAERTALLGELRAELAGGQPLAPTLTLEAWLEAGA